MAYLIKFVIAMYDAKIKLDGNKQANALVTSKELRLSAVYARTAIDEFCQRKHKVPYDKSESIRISSDIYMLFNQQRLDKLSQAALLEHFQNMQVREPSLTALRSKLTDTQLITLVKDRHIQAPSELLAWSNYLNSLGDAEIQAIQAELDFKKVDESEPPQPSPTE